MKRLLSLVIPILYLAVGSLVTYMLVELVLHAETLQAAILPGLYMNFTVFFAVIGVVNIWIQFRTWSDNDLLVYTWKRTCWLYLRCWAIVMAGLLMLIVFTWLHDFIPTQFVPLASVFYPIFYGLDTFLSLAGLMSVVMGENLEEARLSKTQNENQMLKSQLNPHFLYNTLNNIDALIWLDQERASAAVNSLSALMRYFTYSGSLEQVPVGEEIAHLEQVVALQRLRMPMPESLIFETSIDDPSRHIAPLLLLPLLENCFKHCGNLNEPEAISIQITLVHGLLIFDSSNNVKASSAEAEQHRPSGLGTMVLRRRLKLLYRHSNLTMGMQHHRYLTHLEVHLGT